MPPKKELRKIKLMILGGQATPSPPVGPALGQHGVNIGEFCKDFNGKTQNQAGTILPVEVTVYADRTFTYIIKIPPVSELLKKAANIIKGSGTPAREQVGSVTMAQVREIAQKKLSDLNTESVESAVRTVLGTAKSMGIDIVGGA
ncbi:MAG: 50S ribosomal protein L11 [Nitrospirae bacterium]|nr:50S ribosomal protein L11 [Nitrospirota bacterium]